MSRLGTPKELSSPSLIAFHLPQFHRIPENDRWWGEGFTEWANVRRAIPLFAKHRQPRRPTIGLGYYDLANPEVLQRQAELAQDHGIGGFAFYHFWFRGSRLLHKPVSSMLSNRTPQFPFCLCWANESWTRAWDGRHSKVLQEQTYGGEEDWEAHFRVLQSAWTDSRALVVNNRPVFLIYRVGQIPRFNHMINYWRKRVRDVGRDGLHVIAMLTGHRDSFALRGKDVDAACEFAPFCADFSSTCRNGLKVSDYREAWESLLRLPRFHDQQYAGAFVDWDNTPRRGVRGRVLLGGNPERFEFYLRRQAQRVGCGERGQFIFVNSWNEWGEGCYLEPDDYHGSGYLESIKRVFLENKE